ncbi:helix-turn-helix domain-containing protein [Curtanaerobium respiraculi]|uniref:helix-turn-helix domain-containing protein n=1 Tax=Curtanaerobium respiraculi TaxID=2949669 RepID=UPI0024B3B021|nr:helix-turn-helix domain-containing protein [Curtanaerobium respiraculi]
MRDNKEIEEAMAQAIEDRGHGKFECMPPLFTISEVAKYLQVSNTTVYRLIKDGALCGVRIGQSLRFTRKNIEDLLECCAVDENL